ncbi:WD40 repeat-like protein [Violaceomyces palustris]|uniref:WD40 repeat-like protein n=1 Tax=Violaceomyces palustris TaxID=1673888 RepID=A0ACD0P3T3_9BASI|nr:WD40 repeat-like protein [Violaceomyces palustris]
MSASPQHRAISPPTPAPSPQPDLHSSLRLANAISQTGATSPLAHHHHHHHHHHQIHQIYSSYSQNDPSDPNPLIKLVSLSLPHMNHAARIKFLTALVEQCSLRDLAHLSSVINPRLKVDFLSSLPIEVSLHVLSFIDDPKTLARASCVSRFWRSLVNDEHTWKAMCYKHKYRRRASSSAGLGSAAEYARSGAGVSYLPRPTVGPRVSFLQGGGGDSALGLLPLTEEHNVQHEGDGDFCDQDLAQEDDDRLLASLYQRYRDRGLDPSNALHELRTLHDLFLSKQEGAASGVGMSGNLADQMSESDRAFYAQLEEIVAEESQARYGDGTIEEEMTDNFEAAATPGPHEDSSSGGGAHLGWLSAGPGSATNGTRPSAFTTSSASSLRTPTARSHGAGQSSAEGPLTSSLLDAVGSSGEMAMDTDEAEPEPRPSAAAAAAAAASPPHPPPSRPFGGVVAAATAAIGALGSPVGFNLPPHLRANDSPTGRFSSGTDSPSLPSRSTLGVDEGDVAAVPVTVRNQAAAAAHGARRAAKMRETRDTAAQALAEPGGLPSGKKARRRSAPISELAGRGLGLGRPSNAEDSADRVAGPSRYQGSGQRAVTTSHVGLGGGSPSRKPFSYKTHFKLAYLTESNWLRGGRLLTQYTSSDNGAVVTSLAIDSEWIVVGMANSKIHVFDAKTGLYALTLQGHESGVWCLTLVSRCGAKRTTSTAAAQAEAAKGKMVITDPEDGLGGRPLVAAADGDLRLVHHDERPSADAFSPEPSYAQLPEEASLSSLARSAASLQEGGEHGLADYEETLEWFHRARRAMLRKVSSNSALASATASNTSDASAPADGEGSRGSLADKVVAGNTARRLTRSSQLLVGPSRVSPDSGTAASITGSRAAGAGKGSRSSSAAGSHASSSASASGATWLSGGGSRGAPATRSERDVAAAIAEAEAGSVRDAIMADGTGSIPASLAQAIDRNRTSTGRSAPASGGGGGDRARSGARSGTELGGNAAGLGNPCGSAHGYGNEEAIVVSGGCDRDVRVWDLKTGRCKHVLRGHTSTTRCLKVLDGRPIAVSGSRDGTLRVWNIEKGEMIHLLAGHQHSVRCIEVAGNKVASGSYDCTCRIWDLDTGECLHTLRGHIHQIYAVAFDGKRVATGSLDSTVRVWSAQTGECLALFQGHTSLVGQLQLTDKILVTGGSDGRVIIFSLETFECLHRLCAHDNSVTCLQFDERFIVTGGNDGKVKLWDLETGNFIREVCQPSEQVWKVSYRDDKCVVLCKRDGKTSMDVITFKPVQEGF